MSTALSKPQPYTDQPMPARLKAATGTTNPSLQETLVRQVQDTVKAAFRGNTAGASDLEEATLAAMKEMAPQTGVQGMLAAQFVALSFASLECLRRGSEDKSAPAVRDMNLRHAERLVATGLRVLEAFDRVQGRGVPNVTVNKLLNVEAGGQAVIGVQMGVDGIEGAGIGGRVGADGRAVVGAVDVHAPHGLPRRSPQPSVAQTIDHQSVASLAGGPPAALWTDDERLKRPPMEETSDDRRSDRI